MSTRAGPADTKARRAAQAEATRAALIAAARRLFVAKGYYQTGTEEVVAASGVGTRGALYHHFADKKALFEAVFVTVEEDLLAAAAQSYLTGGDAFAQLRHGLLGFLDAAMTPQVQQIMLIDGPAVLGWDRWRELEGQYGLGAIRALLEQAVAEGALSPDQPLDVLAHLLLASTDEAALYIANAADSLVARDKAVRALTSLLDGLTVRAARDDAPGPAHRIR